MKTHGTKPVRLIVPDGVLGTFNSVREARLWTTKITVNDIKVSDMDDHEIQILQEDGTWKTVRKERS